MNCSKINNVKYIQDVLGEEVFNEEVKAAVAEGYFFLADIFIAK